MGSNDNDIILLSHLLFVNDTLIFCEANLDLLHNFCCIFLCFEVVSGLKINLVRVSSLPMKYLDLLLQGSLFAD
jgi:hypothetical protein